MENVPPSPTTNKSNSMKIFYPMNMEPRIQRISSSDEESSSDESNGCSETEDPSTCVVHLSQPSPMITPPVVEREECIQEKDPMFPASKLRRAGARKMHCRYPTLSNIVLPHRALLRISESSSASNSGKFLASSRTFRRSAIAELIIKMKQLRISPRDTSNKSIEMSSVENGGVQAKRTLGVLSNATKQPTTDQRLAKFSDGQTRQSRNSSSESEMENESQLTPRSSVSSVTNNFGIDSNETDLQKLVRRSETKVTTKDASDAADPVFPEGCSFFRFERTDFSEFVSSDNPKLDFSPSQDADFEFGPPDDVFFSPNFKGEPIVNSNAAQKSAEVKVSSRAFPSAERRKTSGYLTVLPFSSNRRLSSSPLKRTLERADPSEQRGVKVLKKSRSHLDLETGVGITTTFRSRSLSPRIALASAISRKVSESSPLSRKRKISISNSENLTRSERSSSVSDSISPGKAGRYST